MRRDGVSLTRMAGEGKSVPEVSGESDSQWPLLCLGPRSLWGGLMAGVYEWATVGKEA